MPTRREVLQLIAQSVAHLYDSGEAVAIARNLASELSGLSIDKFLIDPNEPIEVEGLSSAIEQLREGCPLQYVTGKAYFCDLELHVEPGVLIPRPETEELVAWIRDEYPRATRVLDVGTGSGAIALALKSMLPQAEIFAADISDQALRIASLNAQANGLEVTFRCADALKNLEEKFPEKFDIIVSNPPYIPQSDVEQMHTNVVDFEPHLALFVPDEDPLCFYRAIGAAARVMLRGGGALFFEIYENLASEMIEMLESQGYSKVTLREDFNGKARMICAKL